MLNISRNDIWAHGWVDASVVGAMSSWSASWYAGMLVNGPFVVIRLMTP